MSFKPTTIRKRIVSDVRRLGPGWYLVTWKSVDGRIAIWRVRASDAWEAVDVVKHA